MATQVKLYHTTRGASSEWELIPSKLFIVEDIESYLGTKTSTLISNFQYIKNELEIAINIDLSQSYSQPLSSSNFKYVSIKNDTELTHYYFVKKAVWRSKNCVRFELIMDVLNTFKEDLDYKFKANTRIIREHKPRFILKGEVNTLLEIDYQIMESEGQFDVGDTIGVVQDGELLFEAYVENVDEYSISLKVYGKSGTEVENLIDIDEQLLIALDNYNFILVEINDLQTTDEENRNMYRNIDYVNENINPILQCGDSLSNAIKVENNKYRLEGDWYLLYRNQSQPSESLVNPVDCYLIPGDSGKKVDSAYIENGRLVPSFIEEGKYYYFAIGYPRTYTLSNGVSISGENDGVYPNPACLLITKTNGKLNVMYIRYETVNSVSVYWNYANIEYITITNLPASYTIKDSPNNITYSFIYGLSYNLSFNNSASYNTLDTIEKLDRTDSRNIKLIKLPYCPYNFTIVSNVLQITSEDKWELASLSQVNGGDIYVLKLKDLNTKLTASLDISSPSPFYNLYFDTKSYINPSINDLRKPIKYESKLYHSEFYQPTYFYDSFAFKIQLEKCYLPYYYDYSNYSRTKIDFDMTKTINSKFMFTFKNYFLRNAEQNYSKVMPIARNNEEVLYNVPYINYIRNGYQYDVKNKNISTISNSIGLGLSIASIGASLLAPSTSLKIAGVVGSLVSMAMSIKSTIVSTIQNENSIKQKMTQYQNQASSVAGSDDVDLMSVYAENRLKYLVYEPNEVMKNLLFDLFFYAGYLSNRMGIPNHNTRVNFDYLECEASLEALGSIPQDCLDELVNCFKNGVSYIHKTNRTSNKWDFKQVYENWENELL